MIELILEQNNKPGAGWEDDDNDPQLPTLIPQKKTSELINIQNSNISSNKNIKTTTSSEEKFDNPSSLGLVLSQRIIFENEFELLDLSNEEKLSKNMYLFFKKK